MTNEDIIKIEKTEEELKLEEETTEEETNNIPEQPTEEQQKDPDFDILEAAPEKDRNQFFSMLEKQAQQIATTGDQIIAIHVRPGCLETFMEWYSTLAIHPDPNASEQLKQSIQIVPNEQVPSIHIVTYSQMESQWLQKRYTAMGLFKQIEIQQSPVRLTPDILKLLYGIECLNACNSREIIQASSATPVAPFDPKSIGMKTK